MPHKNHWCLNSTKHHIPGRVKMKHHRWVEQYKLWWDEFHRGQYWLRELICPDCGNIETDIMMRTFTSLKKQGLPIPDEMHDYYRYERSREEFDKQYLNK